MTVSGSQSNLPSLNAIVKQFGAVGSDSISTGDLDSSISLLKLKKCKLQTFYRWSNASSSQTKQTYVLWALLSCYCSGLSVTGPTSFRQQLMDSQIIVTLHNSKFTEILGDFQWTREHTQIIELSVLPCWTGTSWLSYCHLGHQNQKRKLKVRRMFWVNTTVLKMFTYCHIAISNRTSETMCEPLK